MDACHSNLAIDKLPTQFNFEVLVAVKSGTAYDEDIYQKGFFTHYFCEYLAYNKHKDIYLDDIEEYISNQKNSNKARNQQPYYLWKDTSGGKEKRIIASSQMTKDQKNQIKQAYPDNTTLKKAMLSYIKGSVGIRFEKTKNESDYDKLLGILMHSDNKDILNCILAPTPECEKIKEEVLKSRMVESITFIIKPTHGKIENCTVDGWIFDEIDQVESTESYDSINFKDNGYQQKFPQILAKMVQNKEIKSGCELRLVLDNALLKKDFSNLDITLLDGFDCPQPIKDLFHITIKLLMRHETLNLPSQKWKNHSSIYLQKATQTIGAYCYNDNDVTNFGASCSAFGLGCAKGGSTVPFVVLVSQHTTLEPNETVMIIRQGIPIVICRKDKDGIPISIDWEKTTLQEMKTTAFGFMLTYPHGIHFIHDTYDDAIALQALQQNKNDTNFIGG